MSAAWCLASRWDSRRIRSMARLPAVVVSQPPGFGGTPSAGQRSTAASSASAGRVLGDVDVAEAAGRARRRSGRTPRGRSARSPAWVGESRSARSRGSSWKGRTSTLPPHAFEASVAHCSAASRSGSSKIQKPPSHSLDSSERAVGDDRLGAGVVDDRRRARSGCRPPANTQTPASRHLLVVGARPPRTSAASPPGRTRASSSGPRARRAGTGSSRSPPSVAWSGRPGWPPHPLHERRGGDTTASREQPSRAVAEV